MDLHLMLNKETPALTPEASREIIKQALTPPSKEAIAELERRRNILKKVFKK